jgi:3-oxoacyl-[acyl-carrier protein] reductase
MLPIILARKRQLPRSGQRGCQAVAVKADVSKSSDVQELFEQTIRTFGRLDILVNNAGVYRFESIEAVTEEEFHRIYNTNVLGAPDDARSNQAFRAGRRYYHQYCHCRDFDDCPDEFGLHIFQERAGDNFTRACERARPPKHSCQRRRSRRHRDGGAHAIGVLEGPMVKQLVDGTPLGRLGQPEDIVGPVVFLASSDAHNR